MAVAPLNKFLTLAVPVAPGEQTIYTAPVGTSAIILYAQVSNVGIGASYPTVTFTHRRTSVATRTAGNVRNNRVIKDGEIPPNDALVLIDGRLVLERTATISDSIVLTGTQSGISTIMDVKYTNSSGVTTVTTLEPHGLAIGEQITMAGIAFTCSGTYSLTTSIFPEPQAAFTITDVPSNKTFVTNTGIVNSLPHVYNPSIHQFIRSETGSITVVGGLKGPFTPTAANYDPKSGIVSFTVANHALNAPTTHKAGAGTTYHPLSGIMTVTVDSAPSPAFQNGEYVKLENDAVSFSCNYGGSIGTASYPRTSDPISGKFVPISNVNGNTFEIGVGTGKGNYNHVFQTNQDVTNNSIITGGDYTHTWKGGNAADVLKDESSGTTYTVSGASYTPSSGQLVLTVTDSTGLSASDAIRIKVNSLTFSCSMDNHATDHTYPRTTDPIWDTLGSGSNDGTWSKIQSCTVSANQVTFNVGASPTVQYTPSNAVYNPNSGEMVLTLPAGWNLNNDKSAVALAATTGTTYNPSTGAMNLTITGHGLHTGDRIRFLDNSLAFTCDKDSHATEHTYPRPHDPDSNKWLPVTYVDTNNISVTVNTSSYTGIHTFVNSNASSIKVASDSIRLANESIVFTCDKDNYATLHAYPRPTDPYYNTSVSIGSTGATTMSLFVGKSIVNQPHTFVSGTTGGIKRARDSIKIAANSLIFKCSQDNYLTEHSYPRTTDPAYDEVLGIDTPGAHIFQAGSENTNCVTVTTDSNTTKSVTDASYDPQTGDLILNIGAHTYTTSDKIRITANSLTFTCDKDQHATEHTYPRTTDPAYNKELQLTGASTPNITVNVGKLQTFSAFVGISTAGGLVGPLQMEFICSILENSSS